ncbi:MAG: CBU_0592 family membrane protein [Bacteroidia bacterium]
MQTADIISGFGETFILTAFFLSTFKLIKTESLLYYILNIIGGVLACYGSILIHSIPFTILEGIWAIVAWVGLLKLSFKKQTS